MSAQCLTAQKASSGSMNGSSVSNVAAMLAYSAALKPPAGAVVSSTTMAVFEMATTREARLIGFEQPD